MKCINIFKILLKQKEPSGEVHTIMLCDTIAQEKISAEKTVPLCV